MSMQNRCSVLLSFLLCGCAELRVNAGSQGGNFGKEQMGAADYSLSLDLIIHDPKALATRNYQAQDATATGGLLQVN